MKPQRRPIVWASIALALVASTALGWSVAQLKGVSDIFFATSKE